MRNTRYFVAAVVVLVGGVQTSAEAQSGDIRTAMAGTVYSSMGSVGVGMARRGQEAAVIVFEVTNPARERVQVAVTLVQADSVRRTIDLFSRRPQEPRPMPVAFRSSSGMIELSWIEGDAGLGLSVRATFADGRRVSAWIPVDGIDDLLTFLVTAHREAPRI